MKTKKTPKDQLSSDVETSKHEWIKGEWFYDGFKSRVDTCKHCGCERTTISFYAANFGTSVTEVSCYSRSGIHYSADKRPPCWRAKNPK